MNPWALAILAGLLRVFCFAPFSVPVIAWVALVPLLHAVAAEGRPARRASLAALAGLVSSCGELYWLVHTVTYYTAQPLWTGCAALAVVAGVIAGLWAGWIWLSDRASEWSGLPLHATRPAVWLLAELIRLHVLQFPWNEFGYALVPARLLRQGADLFGVYGLSALLVWSNQVFASAATGLAEGAPVRGVWRQLVALSAAVAVLLGYGLYRTGEVSRLMDGSPRILRAALVQGNIPQMLRWDPDLTEGTVAKYLDASITALADEPRIVIWPESALPFAMYEKPGYRSMLSEYATNAGIPLVTGALHREAAGGGERWYNSVFTFEPGDRLGPSARYDKVELVPYGEYVPARFLLPILRIFEPTAGDGFTPGGSARPLTAGSWSLAPLVCYEALFPLHARKLANAGGEILLNVTNDAWFGQTSAPEQLLVMSSLRAVETRRYLLRSANTGITAMADPLGDLQAETLLDTDAVRVVEAKGPAGGSLYLFWGDWPALVFIAWVLGAAALGYRRQNAGARPGSR